MNKLTPTEYIAEFEKVTSQMLAITKAKNKDYSWDALRFKNFETIAFLTDWDTTVEQWFLVRITDKVTRIANLIKTENAVKTERIEDTLLDLSIYAILFKIYIETKTKN